MTMCYECKERPVTHRIVSPERIYRVSYCEQCARRLMEKYNQQMDEEKAAGGQRARWTLEDHPAPAVPVGGRHDA